MTKPYAGPVKFLIYNEPEEMRIWGPSLNFTLFSSRTHESESSNSDLGHYEALFVKAGNRTSFLA